ncbi:type 1 glutamine amidotransferase [Streptomyces sp. NPDC000594]|uniref:type 1 glutamine amidotransferase n=1 Tax=Streptomyces sp. NPDC000594 TaxID=3154261 RepID=UPI0033214404
MTASAHIPRTDIPTATAGAPGPRAGASRPRVLVVQHEEGAGPGLVGAELEGAGLELHIARPWTGAALPATLADHQGLLVLGGSANCEDDLAAPWLPAVRVLIREAVAADLPLLGICLGAQLITVALGGSVVARPEGPEVGAVPLRALPGAAADPVLGSVPEGTPAAQWHWDEIGELPPGAVPLLTGDVCRHQAFRVGRRAWGVQFHPEVLADDVAVWAREDGPAVIGAGLDPVAAVDSIRAVEPVLREVWGRTARAWAGVIHDHRARAERTTAV